MDLQEFVWDTFAELVSIDSPSLHERELAARCARKLVHYGFDVEEDKAGEILGGDSGNLIATRVGSPNRTPLLLTAHLDSVSPCLNIRPTRSDDGWVMSDGSTVLGADDKAGLTAILAALELLGRSASLPTLQVVFTVAEELGLQGAKRLHPKRLVARAGLAVDAEGPPGTYVVTGPSQARWEATVHGRSAPADTAPEHGVSAIKVAAEAVSRMPHGRVDPYTTVNVGSFVGEGPPDVVNDTVRLIGEARSRDGTRLQEVLAEIQGAFESVASTRLATLTFDTSVAYHGFSFAPDDPTRRRLEAAIKRVHLEPRPVHHAGGSDANVFTHHGVPTLNLGIGYEAIHTTKERIQVHDIAQVSRIIAAFCQG